MPAKNAIKPYSENGYYHIYNRGVNKAPTFLDKQDYLVFMTYLKEYLSVPQPPTVEEMKLMKRPYMIKNYHGEITLLSFALMPNHFHLELKQKKPRSIEGFMRSLGVRYGMYFNKRYGRVGHVFQHVYKGTLIERDEYLWWLNRYIHRNPKEVLASGQSLADYPYSSYAAYLGKQNLPWVETSEILAQVKNYQQFVEDDKENKNAPEVLASLSLEDEDGWV